MTPFFPSGTRRTPTLPPNSGRTRPADLSSRTMCTTRDSVNSRRPLGDARYRKYPRPGKYIVRELLSLTWKIFDDAHVHGRQMLLRPDPGEQQQLRGVDSAAGDDYLARGSRHSELAVLKTISRERSSIEIKSYSVWKFEDVNSLRVFRFVILRCKDLLDLSKISRTIVR